MSCLGICLKSPNPRKGIETPAFANASWSASCLKSPNPRKGIETLFSRQENTQHVLRLKSPNPRKGIETDLVAKGFGHLYTSEKP